MDEEKGFIIKCNRCGREDTYKSENWYAKQFYEDEGEIVTSINYGYEEASIECKCGNKIEF